MRAYLSIGLLLTSLACGSDPRAPVSNRPTGPVSPAPGPVQSSPLGLAQGLSEQAYQTAADATEVAVAAAFFASLDRGRLTLTGTIRSEAQGSTYEAAPVERMQVYLQDGGVWTFEFIQQQGSDISAEAFMQNDHVLHIRARGPSGFDAEINSRRQGRQRQVTLRGVASSRQQTYDFDLSYVGTEDFDTDSTGTSYRADVSVAGIVRAPGFELAASERWRFELVSGTGAGAFTANTADRVQDGRLTVDGSVYDYVGLSTRRAFRDGVPTEIDTYWSAQGQVLKDGAPWGQVQLQTTAIEPAGAGSLEFVLQTPGAPVVLESWRVY